MNKMCNIKPEVAVQSLLMWLPVYIYCILLMFIVLDDSFFHIWPDVLLASAHCG